MASQRRCCAATPFRTGIRSSDARREVSLYAVPSAQGEGAAASRRRRFEACCETAAASRQAAVRCAAPADGQAPASLAGNGRLSVIRVALRLHHRVVRR